MEESKNFQKIRTQNIRKRKQKLKHAKIRNRENYRCSIHFLTRLYEIYKK